MRIAAEKQNLFHELKANVNSTIIEANGNLENGLPLIQDNVASDDSTQSLLTAEEQGYLATMGSQRTQLEAVLAKQEEFWAQNIENAKKKASRMNDRLRAMTEKF